jgi:hypothetical protein
MRFSGIWHKQETPDMKGETRPNIQIFKGKDIERKIITLAENSELVEIFDRFSASKNKRIVKNFDQLKHPAVSPKPLRKKVYICWPRY